MTQRCKSCNAEVEWVKTEAGKNLILDAKPDPFGNVVMLVGNDGQLYAKVIKPGELGTKPRRMPHWATCPNAAQHRGKGQQSMFTGKDAQRPPVDVGPKPTEFQPQLASEAIRKTSQKVFKAIIDDGLLSKQRLAVYETLFHYGPLTGRELNDKLSGPSYHKRLSELERLGVAGEVGLKVCTVTKREVVAWDVTDALPILETVRKKLKRPTNKTVKIAIDEIRNLYIGARVRPSDEVKSVMLWLRSEVEL